MAEGLSWPDTRGTEGTQYGPGVGAWGCGCDQMVVFARPKLLQYRVWVEGGVHPGECAHGGMCTAHWGLVSTPHTCLLPVPAR